MVPALYQGTNPQRPGEGSLVGMSVRVVVSGMIVFVDLDRRRAAVGDFTFDTFELDGGVVDAELLAKRPVHLLQDTGALGRRDVVDGDVRCQGMSLRPETPHVQVMHVLDPFNGLQ